jgi:SAM-dependent methyltransferase
MEYPIIDGIPIIVPYIRKYLSDNLPHIQARDDLSETMESIIGDGVGPGTFLDATRQHLSSYAWDHYNDLNPNKIPDEFPIALPSGSSIVDCLEAGLQLIESHSDAPKIGGPVIDIGCSVGRTTFELAGKCQTLTLGIDVNFSMLRLAHKVLREGIVQYPLKRIGIVYDRQEFKAEFANSELVDFWACDALALPFTENSFGFATGFNVFDSVTSPRDLLVSIGHALKPAASALLATPYDWSPAATPLETWIGGHSQRGPDHGAAEPLLRKLLTAGAHPQSVGNLSLKGEIQNHPWLVRVHDRSQTLYRTHILALQAV